MYIKEHPPLVYVLCGEETEFLPLEKNPQLGDLKGGFNEPCDSR